MKSYAILFLFLCICSLYALDVPTNLRATAIGHDALTLRWDAVAGAEGYEVEVMEAAQGLVIDENFDNLQSIGGVLQLPNGWYKNGNGAYPYNYKLGAYSLYCFLLIRDALAYVRLPMSFFPSELRFYARASSSTTSVTLKVQFSTDGINWDSDSLLTLTANGSNSGSLKDQYNEFVCPIAENDRQTGYIRFYKSSGAHSAFIDDVKLYAHMPVSGINLHPETSAYSATMLASLQPETDYIYRVRAVTDDLQSPYSNWQLVRTSTTNSASGSTYANSPATFTLPAIGSYPQQNIEISPDPYVDASYTVSLSQNAGSGLDYEIVCADNAALVGYYTISHPGYIADYISIFGGTTSSFALNEGSTSFTIDAFSGKGTLNLTLDLEEIDETLPVEMGRFMLVQTGANAVNLQWFSYSESELLGYYVLRSGLNDLHQAQRVSELIPATNSSTTSYYQFCDPMVGESSYYWLEATDYSGQQSYYGPEYYQMHIPGNSTPSVLQNAMLSIYPNPFNPNTTISYSLKDQQAIKLSIYDARGRLIHSHDEAGKALGKHQYVWNAEQATSGVYYVQMRIGEELFRRKVVLLK